MQSIVKEAKPTPLLKFGGAVGKFVDSISAVFGLAGGTLLILAAFVICYEVVARYVFNSPTIWSLELSVLIVLPAVFLAVGYGLKEGSHVKVEFLLNFLSAKTCQVLEIASNFFVLVYSLVFVRYGMDMLEHTYSMSEKSSMMNMPLWPIKAAFFLSFVVLTLQAVRMLIVQIYTLWNGPKMTRSELTSASLAVLILLILSSFAVFLCMSVNPALGLILLLLTLLAFGIPIGFSIAIVGVVGLVSMMGLERGLSTIPKMSYMVWDSFGLVSLPLFIFLGYIMHRCGLAADLYHFARVWIGHIPGGLAVATLSVCGIFAAISGSSMANALTVGLIAIPVMISYKYDKSMAAGLVAVGGTLGVLIPPSTAMILIGISTGESIGKLFMAGVFPGIVAFVLLSITAVIVCKKTGSYEPLVKATTRERLVGTRKALGGLMMPVIMLGGIYSGIFTPSEAAAVGVLYAFMFALLSGRLKWKQLVEIITDATKTVAMIAILVAGGMALANVSTMLQLPQKAAEFIGNSGWPGWLVILAAMILILILGMFLDGGAIVLLTMPVLAPVVRALGYDVIWFAVLVVIATEVGLITPPVGLNVYVVQQISGIDSVSIIKGSIPFVLVLIAMLFIVAFFPWLALWLPSRM